MIYYSQKDPKWANALLGGIAGKFFFKYACYLCAISMKVGKDPLEVNTLLTRSNCFDKNGSIYNDTAAKVLGYNYKKIMAGPPPLSAGVIYPTICETDHYSKLEYPQHFFIVLEDGKRVDPLDINPAPELNDYRILSYRCFEVKNGKAV